VENFIYILTNYVIPLLCFHLFCMEFKFYSLAVFIYAYCFPPQFPYLMMFLSFNWNTTGVTRQNMISLPEHWSSHTALLVSRYSFFYCFSVVFVYHCLFLWPLDCMHNKYRLTTYDYPFGISNLLYYLSTHNFSFICMFYTPLFILLYFCNVVIQIIKEEL
jgi:hypothetical protein